MRLEDRTNRDLALPDAAPNGAVRDARFPDRTEAIRLRQIVEEYNAKGFPLTDAITKRCVEIVEEFQAHTNGRVRWRGAQLALAMADHNRKLAELAAKVMVPQKVEHDHEVTFRVIVE